LVYFFSLQSMIQNQCVSDAYKLSKNHDKGFSFYLVLLTVVS
jgi:hypothetical protein